MKIHIHLDEKDLRKGSEGKLAHEVTIADFKKLTGELGYAASEVWFEDKNGLKTLLKDRYLVGKTYGEREDGAGYWLILSSIEEVKKELGWFSNAKEYVERTLAKKGGVIAINPMGGYHGGNIKEYKNIVKHTEFPD